MDKHITEVLIITFSIVLQDGLSALLESLPEITSVTAVKDLSSAYTWLEAHQPRIVFLDSGLPGSVSQPVLERIQAISPQSQRVLLIDNVEELKGLPEYADAILIKGGAPSAVATVVTNLLYAKGD